MGIVSHFGTFYFSITKSFNQMAKRSLAAIVRRLETQVKRKKAKADKKRAKEALKKKAESLRKQLRG